MRQVLLVGGVADGRRIPVEHDTQTRVRMAASRTMFQWYNRPADDMCTLQETTYQLERFQAGRTVMWVGYPIGTSPAHGLAMLMAGYVGSDVQ